MQGPAGAPFGRKGARLAPRVVEKGCGKGFLGWTGPMGRRVLKFDGAFGPEGCGLPFGAQRTHFEGALATRKM